MVPLRGNGTLSTSSAVANGATLALGAPFGNPVVPLVRITTPPDLLGAGNGSNEFAATMSSIVGTPAGGSVPSSTHVSTRASSAGSASRRSENSLS